jgi:hypothetical protein
MTAGKLGMCMATVMLAMMVSTATGSLPQTMTSALQTRAAPSAPPPSPVNAAQADGRVERVDDGTRGGVDERRYKAHNISFGVPLALGSVGATDGVSPPLVFTDNGTIAVVISGAPGACVRVCVCSFMRDLQRTHAQRHAACP